MLLGWIALLLFVVVVLLFSPVPWGALLGLVFWGLGVRGVFRESRAAVERTKRLRARVRELERPQEPGGSTPAP